MEYAWVVSRDDEVEAVLNHPDLHVRPPDQQVPAPMLGTALGEVYSRLVRMNEGARHEELRKRVLGIIEGWDMERVCGLAREAAKSLPMRDVGAYVVAVMVGIARPAEAIPFIQDFAGAIAGGASEEAMSRGVAATPRLLEMLPAVEDADERANLLGFLFQSYAAMAALLESRLNSTAAPPVVLTRRWASRDVELFGNRIRAGQALAVLLTAPRFNFGGGRHVCPGKEIANAIADAVTTP